MSNEKEFNLTEEPWIRVVTPNCDTFEVSLTEALNYQIAANGMLLIPAELTLPGEDGEAPAIHRALIYGELNEKTKAVTPAGVAVWDESTACWTGSYGTSFADYSKMTVRHESRKESRDENGVLLPFDQWEKASEADRQWELAIGENWSFRMRMLL